MVVIKTLDESLRDLLRFMLRSMCQRRRNSSVEVKLLYHRLKIPRVLAHSPGTCPISRLDDGATSSASILPVFFIVKEGLRLDTPSFATMAFHKG